MLYYDRIDVSEVINVNKTSESNKCEWNGYQRRSQNLKRVPQNFMKTFNVEYITLASNLMTSYTKINIASEKIMNYKVTSTSNHQCCQINAIV